MNIMTIEYKIKIMTRNRKFHLDICEVDDHSDDTRMRRVAQTMTITDSSACDNFVQIQDVQKELYKKTGREYRLGMAIEANASVYGQRRLDLMHKTLQHYDIFSF